jgi:hypothetical protein
VRLLYMDQCTATTRKGKTCRNPVIAGTIYCRIHQRPSTPGVKNEMAEAAETDTADYVLVKEEPSVCIQPSQLYVETEAYEEVIEPVVEPGNCVDVIPFEVFLRYEEDVALAYRDYYRDQVKNDKRNELGRFLFGVSFTTVGFIISIIKLSKRSPTFIGIDIIFMASSGLLLFLSALFSLRLAFPKN